MVNNPSLDNSFLSLIISLEKSPIRVPSIYTSPDLTFPSTNPIIGLIFKTLPTSHAG